jgi:ABC-2 type transport system ATP-binding protein
LLADYTEHPRTVILSSHLVDEIAKLLEAVLVVDRGQLVLDMPADDLRGRAVTLTGRSDAVEELASPYTVLRRELLGSLASVTVYGELDPGLRSDAQRASVECQPASLQQLVAHAGVLREQLSDPVTEPAPTTILGASR